MNEYYLAVKLGARFYSTRCSLLRPLIFKTLHFVQYMGKHSADYAVAAIEAVCLWLAALAPAGQKKRLAPRPFICTQNFIAVDRFSRLRSGTSISISCILRAWTRIEVMK